jgi:hypothetical protein
VQTALKTGFDMLEPAYLDGYKEPIIQFGNRHITGTWDWRYQQYGQLTSQDRAKNPNNFYKDWDPAIWKHSQHKLMNV